MHDDLYSADGDDLVLSLHVSPGAGRSEVMGRHGAALKLKVAAPPTGGQANEAVVALVARVVGARPADVELVAGASSRSKRVRIRGVERADLEAALDRELEAGGLAGGAGRRRGRR